MEVIKIKYWFTSDYHLGHAKIIEYSERPFKNVNKMDKQIIKNHNSRVKKTDTVFFLGDFCFKTGKQGNGVSALKWLKKLNGNFVFIRGNHDYGNSLNSIIEYAVIHYGGQDIYMCHRPQDYNPEYELNLVGHVHKQWKIKRDEKYGTILYNVGVDANKFHPVDIQEILGEVAKWKKTNLKQ